jgi:AmmeMemoRadiSam system protein A
VRLSTADKVTLLQLARAVIIGKISPDQSWSAPEPEINEPLKIHCGAFVSVYVEGKLRGCIGTFSEEEKLYRNVRSMAISSATSDTRFLPISAEELPDLTIEISVLSPRKKIEGKEEIILGKHGIYIKMGSNRGTLLPQVALNQNWTVEEFLGNCSKYKAGIGWNGWQSAELYTYEAIVFDSGELSMES